MELIGMLWGFTIAAIVSAVVDYYSFERMMKAEGLYEL